MMLKMTFGQWYERMLKAAGQADHVYVLWSRAVFRSTDGVRIYDRWAL